MNMIEKINNSIKFKLEDIPIWTTIPLAHRLFFNKIMSKIQKFYQYDYNINK